MNPLLDISLFLGRFHPLVVHLPIGFLLFAAAMEVIAWRKQVDLDLAIRYALLLGAMSAALASIFGWLLAGSGGYDESTLSWHKWLGIATFIVSSLIYVLKLWSGPAVATNLIRGAVALMVLLVGVTGHYGGNLTHGSTYLLEHAPAPLQQLAGMEPPRERVTILEQALIYEDGIQHIFNEKCTACHNGDKSKGDLILTSASALQSGGSGGAVLVAGASGESELYRRVTLDPNHEDFMPSEGRTPMTKGEVGLLKWWIDEGAPFETKVVALDPPDPVDRYLEEIGIGLRLSFLETLSLPAVTDGQLQQVSDKGFDLRAIVPGAGLLEVSLMAAPESPQFSHLSAVQDHIVWLELSEARLSLDDMTVIGQLSNLVRLKLDRAQIGDDEISQLAPLQHLEYLNLYGTQISDASIPTLQQLPALKKLYVWQTDMTGAGIDQLRNARPDIEVVAGPTLAGADSSSE